MLDVRRDPALPPLAWAVRWAGAEPVLLAGDGVETWESGWVEGAWDGPFTPVDTGGAWLAGTAGRLDDDGLTLQPPFHSLDAVYAVVRTPTVWASNSLAFVLEASGSRLRSDHPSYLTDLARTVDGLPAHHLRLPLQGGDWLEVMHLLPVTFDRNGERRAGRLPSAPAFSDFDSYSGFLRDVSCALVANASDRRRRRSLRTVTTVSSGYDSPAVAALARACGVAEAVTITEARDRHDRSVVGDSGEDVADALGLSVQLFPRDPRWSVDGREVVAEFLATGMSGEEVPFRRLEEPLRDTLILTGYYGDKVWGSSVGTDGLVRRSDLGGSSLTEFRLRVGACHAPIPFLGAVRHSEIAAVSGSDELRVWRLGGTYDRPIARRLAESAGVPRESFGRTKRAITVLTGRRRIEDRLVAGLVAEHRRGAGGVARLRHAVTAILGRVFVDPGWLILRVRMRLSGPVPRRGAAGLARRRAVTLHGPMAGWTFLWAVETIGRERYRASSALLRDGG